LGYPYPCHSHLAGLGGGGKFPERRDDPEQPEEGSQGQGSGCKEEGVDSKSVDRIGAMDHGFNIRWIGKNSKYINCCTLM
jgi:hypothetical protein